MEIVIVRENETDVAVVKPGEPVITADVQSALDFIANLVYRYDVARVVLQKDAVNPDFFRLSTGFAGEVLQKFVNFGMKLAVYGDFSEYTSKPLRDFMYESNNGKQIFFTATESEAISRLAAV